MSAVGLVVGLEAKCAVNTILGFDDSSIRIAGVNFTSS